MCMNGAHKWRSEAVVAVGEQEAEKWHQSNQSEITKSYGLNNVLKGSFTGWTQELETVTLKGL